MIGGETLKAKLPENLETIRYFGYYVKGASSDFRPIQIIASDR